jgi:alpha-tubulin suppressor-like RCC1 family protein
MNKKILGLFFALAAANAWSAPEFGKSETFPLQRNIAVDINAPGAVRAELAISSSSFGEPRRLELQVNEGALAGGIHLPPGEKNFVSVTAFDERGEKLYSGSGYVEVGEKFTPQVDIRLEGKEAKLPLTAKFGTYRFGLGISAGPGEGGLVVEATLYDAHGNHVPFAPDEVRWIGLPERFELLPYSCFRESLCIELPDPRRYEDLVACMRDIVCSNTKPADTRGPYWYVATGRTHTCALTTTGEIRCWGDNRYGQLRATPSTCASTSSAQPQDCSPVPLAIQCGAGEVCRFQSLAAGGERTCAVDTAGKVWCWGSHPDVATDEPARSMFQDRFEGEVEAFRPDGSKVSFIAVDTDLRHTCAIASTRALYCWEFNQSQLDDGHVHNPGTLYRSVSVGKQHICAQQSGGKFECWGTNFDGQLDGTHTGSSGVLHPGLKEILTRGGHRPAAGSTSTCAQDPDDNTICWGSPSHWVAPTSATGGWMALRHSYATSLASNTDSCAVSGGRLECTRICATGLGGDLFCGNWKHWAPPVALSMVPPPASDHYVSWNQADVGPNHVCAVTTQRDIWCFGTNQHGQFGIGTTSTARTEMPVTPAIR